MMDRIYPQEYLDSAEDQGERDFWDGVNDPSSTYPQEERDAWHRGWKAAHAEQSKISKGE